MPSARKTQISLIGIITDTHPNFTDQITSAMLSCQLLFHFEVTYAIGP